MKRLYIILRIVAYISGLIGVALFVTARQSTEPQSLGATSGGALLIFSFGCFLSSYVVYLIIQLNKHRK